MKKIFIFLGMLVIMVSIFSLKSFGYEQEEEIQKVYISSIGENILEYYNEEIFFEINNNLIRSYYLDNISRGVIDET